MSVSLSSQSRGPTSRPPRRPADAPLVCPVRVALRIKSEPIVTSEPPFLTANDGECAVSFTTARDERKTATFDHVFPPHSRQADVYAAVAASLVHDVVDGRNATVMAYGQTGSGKTYTMLGDLNAARAEASGILPRALHELFAAIAAIDGHAYTVTVSLLEIYGEKLRDLLSDGGRELKIRDVGYVFVESLSKTEVADAKQALDVVRRGFERRATSRTGMNDASSRSHAICTVALTRQGKNDRTEDGVTTLFTFVDLAGSESMAKTQATGQQIEEGRCINKSLLELTKVIRLVSKKERVVSYRGSKLTHLLKDALGGTSKTVFVACVSANHKQATETRSTLDHAANAKLIENAVQPRASISEVSTETASATETTSCCSCRVRGEDVAASRRSLIYAHQQRDRLQHLLEVAQTQIRSLTDQLDEYESKVGAPDQTSNIELDGLLAKLHDAEERLQGKQHELDDITDRSKLDHDNLVAKLRNTEERLQAKQHELDDIIHKCKLDHDDLVAQLREAEIRLDAREMTLAPHMLELVQTFSMLQSLLERLVVD